MANDFTLHFDIPLADGETGPAAQGQADLERAFAREQIRILLEFVTLYQDGKPVVPDGFSIVNAPEKVHALTDGEEVVHE